MTSRDAAERGEDARVEALRSVFGAGADPSGIRVDIGDDGAVVSLADDAVLSVDAHVEGVHFQRGWISFEALGERAAMAALSDLAAMGARPRVVLASWAVPLDVGPEDLEAVARGTRTACDAVGARVVGGNLTRAQELALHTTVIGELEGSPLLRRGAKPGDLVLVGGPVGGAAVGLAALLARREHEPLLAPFVERWRRPRARIDLGRRLRGVASAAIDLSDGLAVDLDRLARASGVRLRVRLEALPTLPQHAEACEALGLEPWRVAAGGGEDYELAFTAPSSPLASGLGIAVGDVERGPPGLVIEDARGRNVRVDGFDHFV